MEEYGKECIKGKSLTFTSMHHRNLDSPFAITSYTSVLKREDTFSAFSFTCITKAQNFESYILQEDSFLICRIITILHPGKETFPVCFMNFQQLGLNRIVGGSG